MKLINLIVLVIVVVAVNAQQDQCSKQVENGCKNKSKYRKVRYYTHLKKDKKENLFAHVCDN